VKRSVTLLRGWQACSPGIRIVPARGKRDSSARSGPSLLGRVAHPLSSGTRASLSGPDPSRPFLDDDTASAGFHVEHAPGITRMAQCTRHGTVDPARASTTHGDSATRTAAPSSLSTQTAYPRPPSRTSVVSGGSSRGQRSSRWVIHRVVRAGLRAGVLRTSKPHGPSVSRTSCLRPITVVPPTRGRFPLPVRRCRTDRRGARPASAAGNARPPMLDHHRQKPSHWAAAADPVRRPITTAPRSSHQRRATPRPPTAVSRATGCSHARTGGPPPSPRQPRHGRSP
jgi:hypothetical protein